MSVHRLRPWIVFLAGGTVLALLVHWAVPAREVLVVDQGRIARVLQWERDLLGRPLTEEEQAETIAELADEEVLLAEARQRGHLARGYVYGRLLKKMRFLLGEGLQVPSDAELRAVYDAHPDRFQRPDGSQVSFDEALPHLRGSWTLARQRELVSRRTAELVGRYRVILKGDD